MSYSNLSKQQKEILDMLTQDYETPKHIAIRRKTSLRAVYKTITKLIEKGYLSKGFTRGFNKRQSTQPFQPPKSLKTYIRLHGMEFNIQIIYFSDYYQKLDKSKIIFIDGNAIRIYEKSIEVYSNESLSFEAEDENRATALSMAYWQKIFHLVEHRLKIVIIKEQHDNIRIVNSHYAEVNNELAKEYNEKKVKLRIYTNNDGKLWFTIDQSWNLNEAETQHPSTAKQDMTKVKAVFNDIRDNPSFLPSEITSNQIAIGDHIKESTKQMMQMGQLLSGNTTLIQRIETGFQTHTEMITSVQAQIMSISNLFTQELTKIKEELGRYKKMPKKGIQAGLNRWL